MGRKRVLNYRARFTVENVTRALHSILNERVSNKELPQKLCDDLDKFRASKFWESDCGYDNIWCKMVLNILGKDEVHIKTLDKYSQLIYMWFHCRKYEEIKKCYREIITGSVKKNNDNTVELNEPANPSKDLTSNFNYKTFFTPQNIATAMYNVLKNEPYKSKKYYLCFDGFEKSDVWRGFSKEGNFWHTVVLAVLKKDQVSPPVLKKYSSNMYYAILNKSTAFNQIKDYFSKLAKNDPGVNHLSQDNEKIKTQNNAGSHEDSGKHDLQNAEINLFNVNYYPKAFPYLCKNIAGIYINFESFETLGANEELDDNIINGYLLSLTEKARTNGKKVVSFETYLTASILDYATVSRAFNRWIAKTDLWSACAWILPLNSIVNGSNHWSLFIVVPSDKLIIYLCSLHKQPEGQKLQNLCCFIQTFTSDSIQWCDWTFFMPQDIPTQHSESGATANNCGVHLCTWAFVLCSGINEKYTEENMNDIRKAIAWTLMNTKLRKRAVDDVIQARQLIFEETGITLESHKPAKIESCKSLKALPRNVQSTLQYLSSLTQSPD